MGAEAEAQMVQLQMTFRGLTVRQAMMTHFATLNAEEPLSRAVELLLSGAQQDFPVLTDGRVAGLLGRRELVSALQAQGPAAPVTRAMRTGIAAVEASAPLEETFQRMQTEELPAVPVTETGRLVGLITMENIAEFLMVRAALGGTPPPTGEAIEREAEAERYRASSSS
jgi:predicted transcriptional regulator